MLTRRGFIRETGVGAAAVSAAMPQALTIDHCARALTLLLEKEGGARNVVMGHSMGGMIAQQAWRYARDRIHGYVLSATSASFGSPDGDWQKEFVRARVAPLDAGKTIPEYAPLMLRAMMAAGASGAHAAAAPTCGSQCDAPHAPLRP